MMLICFAAEAAKFCEAGLAAGGGIGRGWGTDVGAGLAGFSRHRLAGLPCLAGFAGIGEGVQLLIIAPQIRRSPQ